MNALKRAACTACTQQASGLCAYRTGGADVYEIGKRRIKSPLCPADSPAEQPGGITARIVGRADPTQLRCCRRAQARVA